MTLKNYSLTREQPADPLDGLDEDGLLILRAKIDDKLQVELKHINLTEELNIQYRQGKALLESIQGDVRTPTNQKAQVFNSVGAMLGNMVKMQEQVYGQERLKLFEAALLKCLETLPADAKQAFFDLYGQHLGVKVNEQPA